MEAFHHHTAIINIYDPEVRQRLAQINVDDASVIVKGLHVTENFNEERRIH